MKRKGFSSKNASSNVCLWLCPIISVIIGTTATIIIMIIINIVITSIIIIAITQVLNGCEDIDLLFMQFLCNKNLGLYDRDLNTPIDRSQLRGRGSDWRCEVEQADNSRFIDLNGYVWRYFFIAGPHNRTGLQRPPKMYYYASPTPRPESTLPLKIHSRYVENNHTM